MINSIERNFSEFSGGQRAILTLSFILALQKCKPAPVYILDEVDAALDMNYTKNMGTMIYNEFPNSQFFIISHRGEMIENANLVFRTQLVDSNNGRETKITRIDPKQLDPSIRMDIENDGK